MKDNPSDPVDESRQIADDESGSLADSDPVRSPETVDTAHWRQIHQSHYDHEKDVELTTALVSAIAAAKGVDPLNHSALPPLYESIDVQSLEDMFFSSTRTVTQEVRGAVNFEYNDLTIGLRADGWISIYEPR